MSVSWNDDRPPSPRTTVIALLVLAGIVLFGAWVLRPAPEPAGPGFTCEPGGTYTTEECP
jgi:hypothetical protein